MREALQGKIAVVTGAASGIGLATTEALLEAGARVVMVDRDGEALDRLTERLGERVIPQVTDLLDAAQCAALIPEVLDKVEHIDILYCNAGTYIGGNLTETEAAAIDRMLNLNVNVAMKNVHAVIPHMIERGSGDIIITSSLSGHSAIADEPVYSGSKWAITCFVQTMRRQLNRHGIRVGQVSPGPVVSPLLEDWPQEKLREVEEAGAFMEAREVAESVMFMLTRPRHVTIRDVIIVPTTLDA